MFGIVVDLPLIPCLASLSFFMLVAVFVCLDSGAKQQHESAALLIQIQMLNRELSESKAQLEAASKRAHAEVSAMTADLEAARLSLKRSQGQEQMLRNQQTGTNQFKSDLSQAEARIQALMTERERNSQSLRQMESDLAASERRCQELLSERDELEQRLLREEAGRLDAEAVAAAAEAASAAAAAGEGVAVGCQTEDDGRDHRANQLTVLQQQLAVSQARLASTTAQLDEQRASSRQQLDAARAQLEAARADACESRSRLAEADAREADAVRLRQRCEDLGRETSALSSRLAAAEAALEAQQRQARDAAREASAGAERRAHEAEREAKRLAELERCVLDVGRARSELEAQLSETRVQLASRELLAQTLRQQLTEAQQQWQRAHVDMDAERQRLEAEYKEAASLRSSLQQEAVTMKAMGTLVQSKTLKFDMTSVMKLPGERPLSGFSPSGFGAAGPDVSGGGAQAAAARPGSAMPGAGGDGGAAAMRLGGLVRELQQQLQAQARQMRLQQGAADEAARAQAEERERAELSEARLKVRGMGGRSPGGGEAKQRPRGMGRQGSRGIYSCKRGLA